MEHKNMSRWLTLPVVLLLMAVLFLPGTAFANPATAVTVNPASQNVSIGATFTVGIYVVPDTAIAGMQFNLSFNPSFVQANGVTEGNLLKQGGASTYFNAGTINNTAGTINAVVGAIITPGQTVSSPGTFATINFTATAAGTSALGLSNVVVGNISGQPVSITVANGNVTVTQAVVKYVLTMAVAPAGNGTATDLTNASPYAAGTIINIKALAVAGYQFVNWTAPAGTFGNASAAETTFTMPAQDVTVTAHFEVIPPNQYVLTMAVAPAGNGTATDLTNASPYTAGTIVNIKAVATTGYRFVNWTAPAGTFGNASAAETTFTMPAQAVTVTAHFEVIPPGYYVLTMAVAPAGNGTATDLTDASPYTAGTAVSIKAVANAGYRFVNWTAAAGTFGNATATQTTFTMPAQAVTVTAHFEVIPPGYYVLTMAANPVGKGTATDLTNASPYTAGTAVNIKAVANTGYKFVNWTAPAGTFGNASAAQTTFTMPAQGVTITANFELEVTAPVGGPAHRPSKLLILIPWIAIGAAIIVATSLLVRRRRSAMR